MNGQLTPAEAKRIKFLLQNTNDHQLAAKLFGEEGKKVKLKTNPKHKRAFWDNVFTALAIIGVFLGLYYAYILNLESIDDGPINTVRKATLSAPVLDIEGKHIKWVIGAIALIGYRIWLKQQSVLLRILINVLFWTGAFFWVKSKLEAIGAIEIADFLMNLGK